MYFMPISSQQTLGTKTIDKPDKEQQDEKQPPKTCKKGQQRAFSNRKFAFTILTQADDNLYFV